MRLIWTKCRPLPLRTLSLLAAGCLSTALAQVNLYVPNSTTAPPSMSEFTINTSTGSGGGSLTAVTGQTSSPTDNNPLRVAMTPDNRFLYATTQNGYIDAYSAGPGGILTPIAVNPGVQPPGGASFLGLVATQNYLYLADKTNNRILVYSINSANGSLTQVACALCQLNAGTQPTNLTIDSTGTYVYAALLGSNQVGVGTVNASTGAFSSFTYAYTGSSAGIAAGFNPQDLVISPNNGFLYVTDGSLSGNVYAFQISGGTTLSNPAVIPTGGILPIGIAMDPTGSYLFIANNLSNNVSAFCVAVTACGGSAASGLSLVAASGSPFSSHGNSPQGVTAEPTGSYIYVSNESSANVAGFQIAKSGAGAGSLSFLNTAATGTGPYFLLAHVVQPLNPVPSASTWSLAILGTLLAVCAASLYRKARCHGA